MTDWTSLLPIVTGVAGLGVGLFIGSLTRSRLEADLDEARAISDGRHDDIVLYQRKMSARKERIAELEKELEVRSIAARDLHIRVLGMLVTAFGLKPEDLIEYSKTNACRQAQEWKPSSTNDNKPRAPKPMHGELISDYYKRVGQWLEETKTTPRSK